MSTSEYALITLDEAKEFPGMSSLASSDEALIETLIDAATTDIEAYWDNPGVIQTFTEDYTADYLDKCGNKLELLHYPIVSIVSITDPAGNTIGKDDYWIDKANGYLMAVGGWDTPQDANGYATYWTIVYTAGRWANTAAVPADIKRHCKAWVAQLYKRPEQDLVQKSVGDLSLRYREWMREGEGENLIPPAIRAGLARYKKRMI